MDNRLVVVFYLWGQQCETLFDSSSPTDPVSWLRACYDKGFLTPFEVRYNTSGVVLYDESQLLEMLKE